MKAAVVVFPGSNCDRDCKTAIERTTGAKVAMVWHGEPELPAGLDLIVLPRSSQRPGCCRARCCAMPA